MGFLWDLIQQSQISRQQRSADTLEQRIAYLEREVEVMRDLQNTLLERLEKRFGEDIDQDGRVG